MAGEERGSEEDIFTRMSTFVNKKVTKATRGAQEFMNRHFHVREEIIPSEEVGLSHTINPPNYDSEKDEEDGPEKEISEEETKIRDIFYETADKITETITVDNLFQCRNPFTKAFEVSAKLRELAKTRNENVVLLNNLAEKVEDFSVTLMDQVNTEEEIKIDVQEKENMDTYACLLDSITESAIRHEQKKFVSHPLTYRLVNQRWNYGLPSHYLAGWKLVLLYIFTIIETTLTPLLCPFIAYVFYMDQISNSKRTEEEKEKGKTEKPLRDKYLSYLTTPFVIFLKDKLSQFVFIVLHLRISVLPSSVSAKTEEYLILIFYVGSLLTEVQQYRTSQSRVYLRNMWNYVDVMTLSLHALILVLRIITICLRGDPYHNRLLEVVNHFYGITTLLLVLRFSSILEVNKTVGPLQLALFRMCIDLAIILIQFFFVIVAFSVAITMIYTAEISYLIPTGQKKINGTHFDGFCAEGRTACLFKASTHLVWSVFGLTNLETMKSHGELSSAVVGVLYVLFLILSVIMLINMLVALLTNTYQKVETNADVEWKFSRAVVADEYRRFHPIVAPFNIISFPACQCYIWKSGDRRERTAEERRRKYIKFYDEELFPVIKKRYKDKHGLLFPLSTEEKIDKLQNDLQKMVEHLQTFMEVKDQHKSQTPCQVQQSDVSQRECYQSEV
nr:short transient receptor potential channel 4-like isoform X1 [Pocillopora verrucosa]